MTSSLKRPRQRSDAPAATPSAVIRCAIYTRKSTEEGLEQDFNSLHAQREAGENYIRAQAGEGWICLPDQYDDGGYTGGNTDRPALQRLITDIQAGKVDCVVVYKVDRLSRSLMDFSRIMEAFDRHSVSFVSVTQHFNTTNSMGRLTLNILLSFAQFEREIISERTRDKMGAARRKGKWAGGTPVLGYDVVDRRLVVNEFEAEQVRQVFQLYLEQRSILDVVAELNRRGWTTKRWMTRTGKARGGAPFDKNGLNYLLKNVVYVGLVAFQGQVYEGEHAAIVDDALFQQVQQSLLQNFRSGGKGTRPRNGGILSGLVRCQACGCAMTHTYSSRHRKRYRYYVCLQAQKRGYDVCPAPTVPADALERFVVDQIRAVGRDPGVLAKTWAEVTRQRDEERRTLELEAESLTVQISAAYGELSRVSVLAGSADRVADLQEQIGQHQRRLAEIRRDLTDGDDTGSIDDVRTALEQFNPLWEVLSLSEQNRILRLLIEWVEVDAASGEIQLTFHEHGIEALATTDSQRE